MVCLILIVSCARFTARFPWGEKTDCNTFMNMTLYSHLALLNTWLNLVGLSCRGNTVLSECRDIRQGERSVNRIGEEWTSLSCFSLLDYSDEAYQNQLLSVPFTNQPTECVHPDLCVKFINLGGKLMRQGKNRLKWCILLSIYCLFFLHAILD